MAAMTAASRLPDNNPGAGLGPLAPDFTPPHRIFSLLADERRALSVAALSVQSQENS
jgi:hypothetical protein